MAALARLSIVVVGTLVLGAPVAAAEQAPGHSHPPAAAPAAPPARDATAAVHAGHEDHSHHAEKLGTVEFATSCAGIAKPGFERGLALLHSFGYEEARLAFEAAARVDPQCAMAHWGIAMSYYHPLWAPPTDGELAAGRAAAEKAAALGAPTTAREQAYVAAAVAFYRDQPGRDHRARAQAYRAAMEDVARRFPDDHEAAIFHALTLLGTAPPSDTTFAQQKEAAAILERLLPLLPDHPGIAHYVIHSFDYPQLAELALGAARAYAKIAPDSPHAQHMPSHIFTRLGLWRDSIASNLDSAASARKLAALRNPGKTAYDELHALDYLEYAYLQIGQEEKAAEVMRTTTQAAPPDQATFQAGFALAAVPARWALERRAWTEAASLPAPTLQLPWDRFPYALAPTWFARALGAARTGDRQRAAAAVAELEKIQKALAAAPPAGPYDWAGHVESQRLAAAGWLAHAEGRSNEGLLLLMQAADLDERVGKHPVTPGAVLPPRELLADLLLELDKPSAALEHYETALRSAPRRFNALAGAARAAAAAGKPERARELWAQLAAQCEGATTRRAELREARAALAGR
jgi:tetratricopeptide (TPR) repeat protein